MKLPWNRPRSPPSAPVETWGYEDIKAWLWFLRARRFKRAFKSQSGKDLVQMDLTAVQELLGKEHMAVANRIWNSVQELQRREEGSTILNTQNYSQSLTSMSSDVSTLRDASTNQIESDFQGYKDDGNTERMKEVETADAPLPMKQPEGQPFKVPEVEPVTGALALKEGQKENRNGMTRRENGSHSPSPKRANCRTPEKKSRVAFKSLQEIQDNFVPEQPGELESAFAVYSAHGAPYGDKKKSPREHEAKMCGSSFSLMCKSNGLVANHMGRQDVIFSEVKRKEKGAKTISFQEFEQALEKLAALNHVPVHAIRTRVIEGSKEMMINRPQTPV